MKRLLLAATVAVFWLTGCDNNSNRALTAERRCDSLTVLLRQRDEEIKMLRLLTDEYSSEADTTAIQTDSAAVATPSVPSYRDVRLTINDVYYIIGRKGELSDAGIISRSFPVVGRWHVNQSASLAQFQTADSKTLSYLPIDFTGVALISDHPKESYRLIVAEGKKTCLGLHILDHALFWSRTKVLVVAYN